MNNGQKFKVDPTRILALVLAIALVAWASTQPQAESDFWLLAKIGERTVAEHAIPTHLEFPFTQAQHFDYNAHEWLPALLFHALAATLSESTLGLVLGGLGLALFGVVARLAYVRSGRQLSIALGLGILAMLAENYRHFLRPELFTLFYLVGILTLLERQVQSFTIARLGLIFALVTLWANTHGSFVLTLPIAVIFVLDRLRHLSTKSGTNAKSGAKALLSKATLSWLLLVLVVLCATLCTPFGWQLWRFALGFSHQSVAKRDITEWMLPFDERSLTIAGMYPGLVLAALLLLGLVRNRHRVQVRDAGIALLFIALGMLGNRFMVYQGIIFAWVAASIWRLGYRWPESLRLHALAATCIVLLLLATQYGNMNGAFPYDARSSVVLSRGIVAELQRPTRNGNVFNSYDLGGELIYRTYPRLRPSIDTRIDSYGDEYYFWHESLLDSPSELQAFLLKWNVQYMLLTTGDFSRWKALPPLPRVRCAPLANDRHVYLFDCRRL